MQYSAGFDWLAGTYVGYVPEYTILNLNAGMYVFDSMRLGVNVYNLLNRKFYQVFGGTYLPRYFTAKISYEF
jgi:outer membrane receptor protein involved in Fe transport